MVSADRHAAVCPACRAPLGQGAAGCAACGGHAGDTARVVVPTGATGVAAPRRANAAAGTPMFAAFVLVLAALVVAAVLGQWLVSLLLVPVVLTLGVAVAMVAWGDIEEPVDRAVQRTSDRVWAAARVVRVSVVSWSRASRQEAALRARRRRLRLEHERLLRALGQAVYLGDDDGVATARGAALANGAEIERCDQQLRAVRAGAGGRVRAERDATAATEVISSAPSGPAADGERPGARL